MKNRLLSLAVAVLLAAPLAALAGTGAVTDVTWADRLLVTADAAGAWMWRLDESTQPRAAGGRPLARQLAGQLLSGAGAFNSIR